MFNPLHAAGVRAGAHRGFVDPDDLVLAVRVGDDSAAYPIRQMAYHHLVNDRIGTRRRSSPIERCATPAWSGARKSMGGC